MRQPKPFYRKQTRSWYLQLGKRQVNLGRDKTEAWARYHEQMAARPDLTGLPAETTVVGLMIRFLAWEKNHANKPATYEWYKGYLAGTKKGKGGGIGLIPFLAAKLGEAAPVSRLKVHHIEDWLDHREFGQTTRHCAIRVAKRVFNWGVQQGYITSSPIKSLERGRPKRRETIIADDQWAAIIDAVPETNTFHDFLLFVHGTGCRPQEARAVQVRHFDDRLGTLNLPAAEAKGERPRIIYLNPAMLALVRRHVGRYKSGHLFRGQKSRPWTGDAICARFRRLRKKLGLEQLCCYHVRHTFATNALVRDVDSIVVGELMGHADLTQVAKTYQHLAQNPQFLSQAAAQATGT